MTLQTQYETAKHNLLNDKSINKQNRDLFENFFKFQEVKLKRLNKLSSLDDGTFRTLISYCYRFRVVNGWFDNKVFSKITRNEFEKVFNDLCDGKIKNSKGEPIRDVHSYVFKIFKSKLFKMAGLSQIVEESTEFYSSHNEPECNFIEDKDVFMIIDTFSDIKMKLLITLGYDIGENISALLHLKKRDCRRQYNEVLKEHEYLIHLKKETLKRARQERTEPTRLNKTTELLDFVLKDLNDDDYIFEREMNMIRAKGDYQKNVPLSLRAVEIKFDRIVERLGIKTIPRGLKPKLKDIRSSMACDCLKKSWSTDEINSRLGHSITSKVLKPYVTFLALDKKKPLVREYKENIAGLNEKIREQKDVNLLIDKRMEEIDKKNKELDKKMSLVNDFLKKMESYKLGRIKRIEGTTAIVEYKE